jgi:hypothetical protein
MTELERTFEAAQADSIVLLDLRQRRIRELEVSVSRSAAKVLDRRKRYETLLITERNERNALELRLQEAIAHVTKYQDVDRLAEEVGRLSAEARSPAKRLAAKEQKFARELAVVQSQSNCSRS